MNFQGSGNHVGGIQEHSNQSAAIIKSHSIDDILGLKAAAAVHAARAVAALAVTRQNEMAHINGIRNVHSQLVTSSAGISSTAADNFKQLFETRPVSSTSPPSSSSSSNAIPSKSVGGHIDESRYSDKGRTELFFLPCFMISILSQNISLINT